jgi:hypothetical protein
MSEAKRPDVRVILERLKDFQRKSVDYVVRRLYDDPNPADRFLLADEVGLGKTMVAKGVVASAIDRLWDKVDRIDVVYVCSNATIARQNVDRLRLDHEDEFAAPSRMTLLPLHVRDLAKQKVNFVSFTPATSFDLGSSTGIRLERVLLYHLLEEAWAFRGTAPKNLLRGDVGSRRWRESLDEFGRELKRGDESIDPKLTEAFHSALAQQPELRTRFEALCSDFAYDRDTWPNEIRAARNEVIGSPDGRWRGPASRRSSRTSSFSTSSSGSSTSSPGIAHPRRSAKLPSSPRTYSSTGPPRETARRSCFSRRRRTKCTRWRRRMRTTTPTSSLRPVFFSIPKRRPKNSSVSSTPTAMRSARIDAPTCRC